MVIASFHLLFVHHSTTISPVPARSDQATKRRFCSKKDTFLYS